MLALARRACNICPDGEMSFTALLQSVVVVVVENDKTHLTL